MKETEALTVQQQEIQPANNSGGFLQIIDRVVGSGDMTAEKVAVLERLLAMQMTVREEERKAAFANDLATLQAELPQIQKDGRIMVKGVLRSTYALTEDIDTAIRPLLSKYGFSFAFDSESKDGKMFTLTCKLMHKMGHFEVKSLLLPFDASEFRSQIQSVNSTITNGKRILRAMHLNLIERGKDDDGQGGDKKITDDEAKDLQSLMEEVKQDIPRFLKYFEIDKVSDLPAKEFKGAVLDLEKEAEMKLIPLTQGQFAKVDDADFAELMRWKWTAKIRSNGKGFVAKRNIKKRGTQRVIYMSRQIMNSPEGLDVDHINRDTLDNQRCNLRIATHQNNLLNIGAKSTNKTGLKGVSAARKRWRAEIKAGGKRIRLGHFDTPELAHAAYLAAAKSLHGEFAFQGVAS